MRARDHGKHSGPWCQIGLLLVLVTCMNGRSLGADAPASQTGAAKDPNAFVPPDRTTTTPILRDAIIESAKSGEKITVWLTILGVKQKTQIVGADERNLRVKLADSSSIFDQPWAKIAADELAGVAKKCALQNGRAYLALADFHLAAEEWTLADEALTLAALVDPALSPEVTKRTAFMQQSRGKAVPPKPATAPNTATPGAAVPPANGKASAAPERDYRFDTTISRPVLENYLSRATTMMDLCTARGDVNDQIRMLKSIGCKFAGRTLYVWGHEKMLPDLLKKARDIAAKVHAADPDIVLQAGIFEIVTTQVNDLSVREHVFREFSLPVEKRNFRYADMLFDEGKTRDMWHAGGSVPDITKQETRLWFFHLATAYTDAGMEAIHWGQVHLIGTKDKDGGWKNYRDILERARRYAAQKARRHLLLCDAHTQGIVVEGKLLFDLHAAPMNPQEVAGQPQKAVLDLKHGPYRHSQGGITPSGWSCKSLPYIVEFDNWSSSGKGGQSGLGGGWVWGYDEMSWFAHQPEEYRNEWLRYADKWVRDTDPNGHLQMPGSRILHDPVDGKGWYFANARASCKDGFNQEETIRRIWAGE